MQQDYPQPPPHTSANPVDSKITGIRSRSSANRRIGVGGDDGNVPVTVPSRYLKPTHSPATAIG